MEKPVKSSTTSGASGDVIVISNCCSHNCPGNRGSGSGLANAATAVASAVGGSSEYDSLCECSDREDGTCRCRQQHFQQTTWLRPQNWQHWPIIKRVLIWSSVGFVLVWLLVYLVMHFYLQAL